jgi:hypothetical protein
MSLRSFSSTMARDLSIFVLLTLRELSRRFLWLPLLECEGPESFKTLLHKVLLLEVFSPQGPFFWCNGSNGSAHRAALLAH